MRSAALLALMLAPACAAMDKYVKVKGSVKTTTVEDGVVETEETDFDSFAEMPAALGKAGSKLSATSRKLAKKLVDAPPPGKVKLSDLSPALAGYQGNVDLDYLSAGDFSYVQIGVPSYDQFFRSAAELYALAFQTQQALHRLRESAFAVLDAEVDAEVSLAVVVGKALKRSMRKKVGVNAEAVARLRATHELSLALLASVPALVGKVQELVASGQALILGATASLINPKVALHLGLIKKGLGQSIEVATESGALLTELLGELTALGPAPNGS